MRAGRALGPAAFLLLLGAAAAAAQEAGPAEILVEMRLRDGPREVVFALARDSLILAPLGRFLDLAGIAVGEVVAGQRVAGRIEPSGVPFAFDLATGTARGLTGEISLAPGHVVWREPELYVATGVLGAVFGVEFRMDWASLALLVEETGHLPVVQRAVRARRRAVVFAEHERPPPVTVPVQRPFADGAVLDWSVQSATTDPLTSSIVQAGLGAQVLGGSLIAEHSAQLTPAEDVHRTTASWVRAWPGQPWLRQLRLGDVATEGLRPRVVRGAVVTNVPFLRDAGFTTETLQGALAPGWEVELYRGQQLVGYTTAGRDGLFAIDLPVQYGPNPFRTVAYGPFGEVVRSEVTFDIPFRRLPGGSVEYAVGGGQCRFEPCQAFVNGDVRVGLVDRLTVEAGLDVFARDTLADLWHPYAVASGAVTRSVSLTAEAVAQALVRGRLDIAPTPDFRLAVTHTRFDRDVPAPILTPPGGRHATEASVFWRPGLLDGRVFLQASGHRTVAATATSDAVRVAATTRFAGARTVLTLRRDGVTPAGGTRSSRLQALLSGDRTLLGPGLLRGLFVRGAVGVADPGGVSVVSLGAGRRFLDRFRLDVGGGWERGRGGFLELNFTTVLPWIRANSRNVVTADGTTGIQLVEGSLLWDSRSERLTLGNGRALGRGGIAGEIFLDENGNGQRDPDELPLGGVGVRIGAQTLRADSLGRFRLWDLVPFEGTVIEVDTLSLQNPLWVPVAVRTRLTAGPHTYQYLPIPVLPGGEIAGAVRYANGRPAGGIRVVLEHLETGRRTEVLTFSDGAFYAMGLRPGRYEIAVHPEQLADLDATAAPVRATLRQTQGGTILEGVELIVERG